MLEVLVHGDQDVKHSLCQRKQLAIFLGAENCFSDRFAVVPATRKEELHFSGQELVQQQLHFNAAAKVILASSSAVIAFSRVTPGKSSRNSVRLRSCSR